MEQECLTAWNDFAEQHGLAKVMVMNASRKAKLKRRLKDVMLYAEHLGFDNPVEGWNIALDKIAESDFLLGKKTDFKASFDFMMRECRFHKLMEDGYANVTKQTAGGINSRGNTTCFGAMREIRNEYSSGVDQRPRSNRLQIDRTVEKQGRLFG